MIISDTRTIHLNTRTASHLNGSLLSKVSWFIKDLLEPNQATQYTTIKVLHMELPRAWYVVNSNNDRLQIDMNSQSYLITLTHGNYQSTSFIAMLQPLMPSGFSITFSDATGRYSIAHTTYDFAISNATCYELLGLAPYTSYNSISRNFECPFPCSFLGTSNVYVKSGNLLLSNYSTLDGTYNNLINLQVNVPPYGVIKYSNITNTEYVIRNTQLSYLELELKDEFNSYIDMNGVDWSLTIELNSRVLYVKNEVGSISQYLAQQQQEPQEPQEPQQNADNNEANNEALNN